MTFFVFFWSKTCIFPQIGFMGYMMFLVFFLSFFFFLHVFTSYFGFVPQNNYLSSRYKAAANTLECFHCFLLCSLHKAKAQSTPDSLLPRLPGTDGYFFLLPFFLEKRCEIWKGQNGAGFSKYENPPPKKRKKKGRDRFVFSWARSSGQWGYRNNIRRLLVWDFSPRIATSRRECVALVVCITNERRLKCQQCNVAQPGNTSVLKKKKKMAGGGVGGLFTPKTPRDRFGWVGESWRELLNGARTREEKEMGDEVDLVDFVMFILKGDGNYTIKSNL